MSRLTADEALGVRVITWRGKSGTASIEQLGMHRPPAPASPPASLVLTKGRVHFGSAPLDFVLGGATAVADAAAHLFVSVGLGAVGQTVAGLPAVET